MSSDNSSPRDFSPSANQPGDPPDRSSSSSSTRRNTYERQQQFFYSTAVSNSTKSSSPSETDSDSTSGQAPSDPSTARSTKTNGSDEHGSDSSAAAMLTAFQYGVKDDTTSQCPTATTASSMSFSTKQESNTTDSDPLGLLQRDRTTSTARSARERVNKKPKRRPVKSKEELKKDRLAANRRSAAVSRQRCKILIEELQSSVAALVKENASLVRENEQLREQVERLREENRYLASCSSDDESDDSESPSQHSSDQLNPPQFPPPAQLPVGNGPLNGQLQQFSTAPTNIAGLGMGLGGAASSLLLSQAINPNVASMRNNQMYGHSFGPMMGMAGPSISLPTSSIQQPQFHQGTQGFPFNAQLQQVNNAQLQQVNNAQLQQVNNAQMNQGLLQQLPPHVIRMLMERQLP